MTFSTRRIGADDWAALRDVRLRSLADSPDAFGSTLAAAEALAESVWRERASGSGPVVLAFDDSLPVALGGAYAPPDATDAMIWGMWTAPEARGHGLARRILADLLAWCRDRGLGVLLDVTEGNDPARHLYVAAGFVPTGAWEPLRPGSSIRTETMRLPPQ